jgi:hypothetical protein
MKVEGICPNNECPSVEFVSERTHLRHVMLADENEAVCSMCQQDLVVRRRVPMQHRFPLGDMLITRKAMETCVGTGASPGEYIQRHVRADWGAVESEQFQSNNQQIVNDYPTKRKAIVSHYRVGDTKIIICTESPRHETTVFHDSEH